MEIKDRVTPLVFGYSPNVQLDWLGGEMSWIEERDRLEFYAAASHLTTAAQSSGTVAGVVKPLRRGELLLIALPVTAPERSTKRSGLHFIYGYVSVGRKALAASMAVALLSSTAAVISERFDQSKGSGLASAAELLTDHVQHDQPTDLEWLRSGLTNLSSVFSSLLAGPPLPTVIDHLLRRRLRVELSDWGWAPTELEHEPALLLTTVLVNQSAGSRRACICYRIELPRLHHTYLSGAAVGQWLVGSQLFVATRYHDPKREELHT